MKRDVQVGVILGVIILAIIGVFLSTRTTVKEPTIPIPEVKEDTQTSALNINELPQSHSDTDQESFKETIETAKKTEQKGLDVIHPDKIQEQQTKKEDNNVIEVEWKNAKIEKPTTKIADTAAATSREDWKDIHSGDSKISPSGARTYKVQYRDDLYKIAKKYYNDVSKWLLIFNANKDKIQDRNNLKVGTELIIPEEKTGSQVAKKETNVPSLSQVIKVEDKKSSVKKHMIQQGDSLYKIALQYYNDGSKWNKIVEANKNILKNQKNLKVGQEIVIPDL